MNPSTRVPVTVLTGYLGSGKTTLLKRLLEREEGRRAAVLINEFGEVGLDHLLARSVTGNTVVLRNGCVCCSVREDLRAGLRALFDERHRKAVPAFDRIFIETSGLADPAPIVQTLVADPMLRNQSRLAQIVATVDVMNALEQFAAQPEALRQAATADSLVLTKTDISDSAQTDKVLWALNSLNPAAPILQVPLGAELWQLLSDANDNRDPAARFRQARPADKHDGAPSVAHKHAAGICSFVYRTTRRVDWTAFAVWLSLLVHRHGERVLRVKGLLDVPGASGPLWLNAVQHFVHPPEHLDAWPDADRSSRLVFITRGLTESDLVASLERFLAMTAGGGESPCAPSERTNSFSKCWRSRP